MGTRELKALLRTLRAAGVTKYATPDLSVTFGDLSQPEATAAAPDQEPDAGSAELPDGVYDPVGAIQKLNTKHRIQSS